MDYRRMWIYLTEMSKECDDQELIEIIKSIETAEERGELLQFEYDNRIKWVYKLLDQKNFESAIRVLQGAIEIKKKMLE
jgi:hypothetical protein